MLDSALFGGGQMAVNVGEVQNASRRIPGIARNTVGMRVTDNAMASAELGGDFSGKLTIGMLEVAIVGLVLVYIWTKNVQGGG